MACALVPGLSGLGLSPVLVQDTHSASPLHPGLSWLFQSWVTLSTDKSLLVDSRGVFCFWLAIHLVDSAIRLSINWGQVRSPSLMSSWPGVKMDTGQHNAGG